MELLGTLRKTLHLDDDVLAEYRPVIIRQLSAAASAAMLLITVMHATAGRLGLALAGLLSVLVMLGNSWSMWRGRAALLPFHWLATGLLVLIGWSVVLQGLAGVLWSYALLFIAYFVLPRLQATLLCGLVVASMATLIAWRDSADLAVRLAASQLFVVLMVNSVLGIISRLQQALRAEAITDPLTGAYNRRHLQAQLAALGTRAQPKTAGGAAVQGNALLSLDIDHFKSINDRHGHAVGDEVLRRLVAVLSARKRINDLLFRTGGEEFMLLLPRTSQAAALELAEQLRQRVAASPLLPGERVTVSIGVSVLAPGQEVRHWLKAVDSALYEAKRKGRDQVAMAA